MVFSSSSVDDKGAGGGLGGGGGGGRERRRAISLDVNDGFDGSVTILKQKEKNTSSARTITYGSGAEVRCNFSNSSICISACSNLLTA
jgi:hypothetical protein